MRKNLVVAYADEHPVSAPPSVQELAHELVIENLRDVDLKEFQYKPGQRF